MFVDQSKITIKAGDGGDGAVSFRREKFVAAGGPDGGDGGNGGDIYFIANKDLTTLIEFRYKNKYFAEDGENGKGKKAYGKQGKDLYLSVPKGTLIKEIRSDRLIADISEINEPVLIAKGGRGGWGNTKFATATRQIPRFSKPGTKGEKLELYLELKLIADVGLVGFPNVGKSTLISVLSGATPKIANYHFTTLSPHLGVVKPDYIGDFESSYVMADIPGLIEGASDGVGLGHEFLRHVERCRLIVHIVDISGIEGRDPKEDFLLINSELEKFDENLAKRPQLVVGNKIDMATEKQILDFKEFVEKKGYKFYPISAVTNQGVKDANNEIFEMLSKLPPVLSFEPDEKPEKANKSAKKEYSVTVKDEVYYVDAPWLVDILEKSDLNDYESLQYFQRVLLKSGIVSALEDKGIKENDLVNIHDFEFNFMP